MVNLLPKFADSPFHIVNEALYRVINNLKKFVDTNSSAEKNLRTFANQLSKGQVQRLGWQQHPQETEEDTLTRPLVLNAALYAKNPASLTAAHQLFVDNQQNLAALSADIRVLVLKNEVQNFGNQQLFDKLLTEYRQTADGNYKADLCAALTQVTDSQLVSQIVQLFEDSETIKPQDLRAWFYGLLANPQGQQKAWNWLRDDWSWLEQTVGGDMEFSSYITVIAQVFRTPARLQEFRDFFEPKLNTPGLTREIKMDTSIIASRVQLISEEQAAVNEAVKQQIN